MPNRLVTVGYFFISGFEAVADNLAHLRKVRILVGRTDRHILEEVASGLQQAPALYARIESEGMFDAVIAMASRSTSGTLRLY